MNDLNTRKIHLQIIPGTIEMILNDPQKIRGEWFFQGTKMKYFLSACASSFMRFFLRSVFHFGWTCEMQLVRKWERKSPRRTRSRALLQRRRNFHESKNVSVGSRWSSSIWGGQWDSSIWTRLSITRETAGLVWRQAWKHSLQCWGSYWRYEWKILFVVWRLSFKFSLVISGFNKKFKEKFTINCIDNLNQQPELAIPSKSEEIRSFCCLFCKSGPFKMTVTIPMSGFAPGQNIPVTVAVNNKSKIDCERTNISLNLIIRYNRWVLQNWKFLSNFIASQHHAAPKYENRS